MTTDLGRVLAASVGLCVALGLGCGSPATQATIYIDTTQIPASLRADYEAFTINCSKCHGLSRAFNAHVQDPEHWDLYVARMMRTAGSAISPQEGKQIVRFLHWYTKSYNKRDADSQGSNEPSSDQSSSYAPAPAEYPPPSAPQPSAEPLQGVPADAPTPTGETLPAQPGEAQP